MKLQKRPKRIPEPKNRVKARLAASDILSLTDHELEHTQVLDEVQVEFRLARDLKISVHESAEVRKQMIAHLRDSKLTINFEADALFKVPLNKDIFENCFSRPRSKTYMEHRDEVEEKMFDFSGNRGRLTHKNAFSSALDSVTTRIKLFGTYDEGNNRSFEPELRPKYAAINFEKQKFGAVAGDYGWSHMVLKEHVKHRCTFTDRDSFRYKSQPDISVYTADYFHMDRLLLHMHEAILKRLYKQVSGISLPPDSIPMFKYIEAQIHGNLVFSRDIEKICIKKTDVSRDKRYYPDALDKKQYQAIIEHFTKKNNIALEYID